MSFDLRTPYLGMALRCPLIASSSPLTNNLDDLRRLEDAGAGAVVLPSLFEEQIEGDSLKVHRWLETGAGAHVEASTYFPELDDYDLGPDSYLELVTRAAEALEIPVIASLNGATPGGWLEYAGLMQEAGAAAIELNLYDVPVRADESGVEVEARHLQVLTSVKQEVSVPVALKLSPFFSAFANLAERFDAAGADALVLFNRFYQPDFDLEARRVAPLLQLSEAWEIRLPLTWIALLYGRLRASLAATSGVQSEVEVLKLLMAGADVVMTTSVLLKRGIPYLGEMLERLRLWLEDHEYESLDQLRGSMSHEAVDDPAAFVRANYIHLLGS